MAKTCMICGGMLQFISYTLMGPVPFLSSVIIPTSASILSLQALFGIGLSCSLLPSYSEMVTSTISEGTKESAMVYGIISALFNCAYNLGEGIGPVIGGYMNDQLQFEVKIFI